MSTVSASLSFTIEASIPLVVFSAEMYTLGVLQFAWIGLVVAPLRSYLPPRELVKW
jgi:hypothetical protein